MAAITLVASRSTGEIYNADNWYAVFLDGAAFDMRDNILLVLLFCFYAYVYGGQRASFRKLDLVLSIVLVATTVAGISVDRWNGLNMMYGGGRLQLLYCAIVFIGDLLLVYPLLNLLLNATDARFYGEAEEAGDLVRSEEVHDGRVSMIKRLGTSFLVIALCWLPYWVAYFPGNGILDAFSQVNQFKGGEPWTNFHPLLGTIIMGSLVWLGERVCDLNTGMAFAVAFQYALLAFSMAYAVTTAWRLGARRVCLKALLAFFALMPVFPFYATSLMKDTLYYGCILLFYCEYMLLLTSLVTEGGQASMGNLARACAFAILTSLIRKNGIYIVVPSMLVLALMVCGKRQRVTMLSCSICIVLGYMLVTGVFNLVLHPTPSPAREMLSLPFQQTARTVRDKGDELSESDVVAIDGVLDYATIGAAYDSDISDPVKSTFKEDGDLGAYLRVWVTMGVRYPLEYLEAALCQTYSYCYIFGESTTNPIVWSSWQFGGGQAEIYADLSYITPFEGMRELLPQVLDCLNAFPVVGTLTHVGCYTWAMVVLVAWHVRHASRGWCVYVPPMLALASCLISPVNGDTRYYLPIMLMVALAVTLTRAALGSSRQTRDVWRSCAVTSRR